MLGVNLYRKILTNPELEGELVSRITAYVISKCSYALESAVNATSTNRDNIFMRAVDQFLPSHQCLLLAIHFNKEIEKEQSAIKSR